MVTYLTFLPYQPLRISSMRSAFVALLIAVISSSKPALAQNLAPVSRPASAPVSTKLQEILSKLPSSASDPITATKRLPVQGLSIVETSSGKSFLVSDNGRLAIVGGRIIDLFENREIHGISDAASLDKIDLARLGIKPSELATFTIGTGDQEAVLFIDPLCDKCRTLISEVTAFSKNYTFHILLYPLRGGRSGVVSRAITCSPNKQLALQALITGHFETLPAPSSSCDVSAVQKAIVTGAALHVNRTPFLILPNGKTHSGDALRLSEALTQ